MAVCLLTWSLLASCGGDDSKQSAPPGSPENPLVAKHDSTPVGGRLNEAAATDGRAEPTRPTDRANPGSESQPGYEALVDRQSRHPQIRFTPCNLVTKAQARAIIGAPIRDPLEGFQGPTCIYQTKTGKGLVTLAVQSVTFRKIRPLIRQPKRIQVSSRTGYCGQYGQAMLYLPLSGSRVLTVAAPCPVARRFAAHAVEQLKG